MTNRSSPDTIQLRVLAKRCAVSIVELRKMLRAAGVKNTKGTGSLNRDDSVNIAEASKALGMQLDAPAPADPLAKLEAASAAVANLPDPSSPIGTGNEDDPIPPAILSGEANLEEGRPPVITNPDPDKVYWWINVNQNRQLAMRRRGWRFITTRETQLRIRPDGRLMDYRNELTGRIVYGDLELAHIPKAVFLARKKSQHEQLQYRRDAVAETAQANIDHLSKVARDKIGKGEFQFVKMDADQAAAMAAGRRQQ